MKKEPDNIDQFLPYGEMLRGFMEQSFIGKSDLKDVLRNRGVFTCNTEKQDTIPILSSTILSPSEFDHLRECQNSKEDNPKIITRTIEWQSEDNLFDSIPEKFDVSSVLDLEFSNFKVVGSPSFVPVDNNPNCVKMDFFIEREDLSKNWSTNKSIFPGSIEIKREKRGDIQVVITHTANETKQVAYKASNSLVKHFKEKGLINSSHELEKILFSKFSNPKRVIYLLSLTQRCRSSILDFVDIVDVEFSPDPTCQLPQDIRWMEKKINDLKLNGNALHETVFFKKVEYYDYLHLYKVDAKFKFNVNGSSGNCVISMGFPDYGHEKNTEAEMEVNIKSLYFDNYLKGVSKPEIKEILLKEIEGQKIASFQTYRIDRDIPAEISETLDPDKVSQPVSVTSNA
jgi:hypothetical protein